MDTDRLVEQITDIVMAQLAFSGQNESKIELQKKSDNFEIASEKSYSGIIILTEARSHLEEFWSQIRSAGKLGIKWSIFSDGEIKQSVINKEISSGIAGFYEALPPSWKNIVAASDVIVVPVMTVSLCSKIAHLINDDVSSKISIQALIERKPVITGAEEISFLTRFSAQLPKPLVSVMNGNFEAMRSMGFTEVSMNSIESGIRNILGRTGESKRGSNVITKIDIVAAIDEGKSRLEFRRGTIITPLAREFAEKMNVEINIR